MFHTKLINFEDSGYIFPNLFTGFVFFMIFCSFLFRHFTVIDEPTLNFSFYKHITITWIFSRADYIEFHEKHFFKHKTLRKDFEKSHITLHEKKDLNLQQPFFSESEFSYHSSLRLCTTKVSFLIEPIKISIELSNRAQYLYLQLDSINKIRCLKNHSLYLKLILLLSGDISLNSGPNRTNN